MTTTQVKPAAVAPAVAVEAGSPSAVIVPGQQAPGRQIPGRQGPETRKFTVAEYYRMADAGILSPEERVQLIEGEIIVMPPMGPGHAGEITRSNRLLGRLAADRFLVCSQTPLHLDDGCEPEPDVMLVRPRADCYETAHPTPADTFVVLEVSDSTLQYDRGRKANLYGRAGIAQTLVLNLPEDCIEDFTEPGPEGYGRHIIRRRGEKIRLVALPDLELAVDDLLPLLAAEEGDGG